MTGDFPRDLRTTRRSRGDTQTMAAHAVGVTTSTWARWENGQSQPLVQHIPAVAKYLGVKPEEVVHALVK